MRTITDMWHAVQIKEYGKENVDIEGLNIYIQECETLNIAPILW